MQRNLSYEAVQQGLLMRFRGYDTYNVLEKVNHTNSKCCDWGPCTVQHVANPELDQSQLRAFAVIRDACLPGSDVHAFAQIHTCTRCSATSTIYGVRIVFPKMCADDESIPNRVCCVALYTRRAKAAAENGHRG